MITIAQIERFQLLLTGTNFTQLIGRNCSSANQMYETPQQITFVHFTQTLIASFSNCTRSYSHKTCIDNTTHSAS